MDESRAPTLKLNLKAGQLGTDMGLNLNVGPELSLTVDLGIDTGTYCSTGNRSKPELELDTGIGFQQELKAGTGSEQELDAKCVCNTPKQKINLKM